MLLEDKCKQEGTPLPDSYRTICIDLNGVLDMYDGWTGEPVDHPPRPGAELFLATLKNQYRLVCFTAAPLDLAKGWLDRNGLLKYFYEVTNVKQPAIIYLDDRAVYFNGDFEKAIADIRSFSPHWAKEGQIG